MAMCAEVQKVSRPMERCQETSQWAPMATEVTARAAHQRYQGICAAAVAAGRVGVRVAILIDLRLEIQNTAKYQTETRGMYLELPITLKRSSGRFAGKPSENIDIGSPGMWAIRVIVLPRVAC